MLEALTLVFALAALLFGAMWRSAHNVVMALYSMETDEDWKELRQEIAVQRARSALYALSKALCK